MGPLAQLPVCDIVDLLLLALVRHKASAVTIEPAGNGHAIRYERGTSTVTLETLTPERGDAVVMRLAIVFGIAVGSSEEQIGRLRIRGRRRGSDPDLPAPPATEILVAIRPTASGLSAELHRFAGPEDQVPGGELVPVASDSGPEDNRRIGPYRISTELGRGSMGIVYRAEHLVLQKAVAIKILHPGMAGDPEAAARFIMEARAACRARHPGIVDVTDFGRLPGGRAFLVMELVEGPTLEVVLQSGPLAPARAIRIAAAVAEALRAASAHCVVHRELSSPKSATEELSKSPPGNAPGSDPPRLGRSFQIEKPVVGPPDRHLPGSPSLVFRLGRAAPVKYVCPPA
ncbi:MAG TPA: protein kinase [Pseudomonadota bacterium]|nr:protein kinase [Pseudomonadota bacterium]